jgi:hypothetical protein
MNETSADPNPPGLPVVLRCGAAQVEVVDGSMEEAAEAHQQAIRTHLQQQQQQCGCPGSSRSSTDCSMMSIVITVTAKSQLLSTCPTKVVPKIQQQELHVCYLTNPGYKTKVTDIAQLAHFAGQQGTRHQAAHMQPLPLLQLPPPPRRPHTHQKLLCSKTNAN